MESSDTKVSFLSALGVVISLGGAMALAAIAALNSLYKVHFFELLSSDEWIPSTLYFLLAVTNLGLAFISSAVPRQSVNKCFATTSTLTALVAIAVSLRIVALGPQGAGSPAAGIGFLMGVAVLLCGVAGLSPALNAVRQVFSKRQ